MKYLLDTDTIIFWLKGDANIENRALSAGLENIAFSIISLAELYYGTYNSKFVDDNIQNIQRISETIALISFDEESARRFGEIKAGLKKCGKIILDADIMIASIALSNNLTLVTNNTKHYARIQHLMIENWKK